MLSTIGRRRPGRLPAFLTLFVGIFFIIISTCQANSTGQMPQASPIKLKMPVKKQELLQPPKNLTETAEVINENGKRYIQLTLAWSPPDGIQPSSYELIMHSNQSGRCVNDFIAYHKLTINASETEWTIPHEEFGPAKKIIHFNCSYIVQIFSRSPNYRTKPLEKIIHIPKCMQDKNCECRDSLSPPENLEIYAEKGKDAIITWRYRSQSNISSFGVTVATSDKSNGKEIWHKKSEYSFPYTGQEEYSINASISNDTSQRVTVKTYDEIRCIRSLSQLSIECSSSKCFCSDDKLSVVENINIIFNTNESFTHALIHWSYPTQTLHKVETFDVEIDSEVHPMEIPDLKKDFTTNDMSKKTNPEEMLFNFPYVCNTSAKNTHVLSIRAINRSLCRGPATREIVFNCHQGSEQLGKVIVKDDSKKATVAVFITIGVLAFVVLVGVGLTILNRKTILLLKLLRLQGRHSITDSMGSDTSRSTGQTDLPVYPVEMESINAIYVPQEIREAIAKGLADKYEIPCDRLSYGRQIGKGAFGRVFLATAESIAGIPGKRTVAVKQLKDDAENHEREEFLDEIKIIKKVGRHPNIVTMIACCTLKHPYCIVMEFVPCGDLLKYLKRLRAQYENRNHNHLLSIPNGHAFTPSNGSDYETNDSGQPLLSYHTCSMANSTLPDKDYIMAADMNRSKDDLSTVTLLTSSTDAAYPTRIVGCSYTKSSVNYTLDAEELHNFASQIALGMCHLSSIGITHRDLAARNILIDENKTLKISDFGLSRTGVYVLKKGGLFPLRWLSVEAITNNIYTVHSDVWAFGVILWEICTLGGFPYASMEDAAILPYLLEGNRLEKPPNCDDKFFEIMEMCWRDEPTSRPNFHELHDLLAQHPHVYVNFDIHNNVPLPPSEKTQQDSQDTII